MYLYLSLMKLYGQVNNMNYVIENWDAIVVALLAVVGAASVIAKLTPTTKDDEIVAKIKAVLDVIALNPKNKP